MGQDWAIVDMDSRVQCHIGKLGESLFHTGSQVRQMLWKKPPVPPFARKMKPSRQEGSAMAPRRLLLALPNELVDMIFDLLGKDWNALVSLSVTCCAMWEIGIRHLHKYFVKVRAKRSSSGHRLLCLGDYTDAGDLPPHLQLTKAEKRKFASSAEHTLCDLTDKFRWMGRDDLRSNLIYGSGRRLHREQAVSDILEELLPREERMPPDDVLVLRNLSKRVYVSGKAVAAFNARMGKKYECYGSMACLGSAALVRICWSSSSSTNTPYRGPLHRGVWAGDRFDIVSEEMFEHERGDDQPQPWADVSKEVLAEFKAIWVAEGLFRRR
ncbi:hypothetical protein HDZ31DRAFT_33386 [Schizophyllum fasciatum]